MTIDDQVEMTSIGERILTTLISSATADLYCEVAIFNAFATNALSYGVYSLPG
jgi:hypothetical protein